MISDSGDESMNIRTICLPNFEVSWAGGSPGKPGCWFGSDDGRVQFMSLDGAELIGPYAIAPSEEAVNGIAFAGGLMAVSTRNDVTFLKVPGPRGGHSRRIRTLDRGSLSKKPRWSNRQSWSLRRLFELGGVRLGNPDRLNPSPVSPPGPGDRGRCATRAGRQASR